MTNPVVSQQAWRVEEHEEGQRFNFIVNEYVVAIVFRFPRFYRVTMTELTREVIRWPVDARHEFDLPDLEEALAIGHLIKDLFLLSADL